MITSVSRPWESIFENCFVLSDIYWKVLDRKDASWLSNKRIKVKATRITQCIGSGFNRLIPDVASINPHAHKDSLGTQGAHIYVLGWFQVEMKWIVQTSGFEIIKILHKWSILIEKFLWKSAKLCIIMADENLQIYGDFEYFLVFTKPEWTGPVLVLKFRCTI